MTELFNTPTGDITPEDNQDVNPLDYATEKFKKEDGTLDVEALAKAKLESDKYIKHLQENELAGLREELTKRLSMEEALEKINEKLHSRSTENNQHSDDDADNEKPSLKGYDKDIVTLEDVKRLLDQDKEVTSQKQNIEYVHKELVKAWGDNFESKLKSVIHDLELTEEEASATAATKPKAFIRLVLGTGNSTPYSPAPPQGVRFGQSQEPVKNYAHYEKLRKSKDPKDVQLYWSAKVQAEMHKQAHALGDAFYR